MLGQDRVRPWSVADHRSSHANAPALGSSRTFSGARRGFSPYSPSKAALESETQSWAQELADTGVTVNAILPGGATLTGMVPDSYAEAARKLLLDPDIIVPPLLISRAQARTDSPASVLMLVNGARIYQSKKRACSARATRASTSPTGELFRVPLVEKAGDRTTPARTAWSQMSLRQSTVDEVRRPPVFTGGKVMTSAGSPHARLGVCTGT